MSIRFHFLCLTYAFFLYRMSSGNFAAVILPHSIQLSHLSQVGERGLQPVVEFWHNARPSGVFRKRFFTDSSDSRYTISFKGLGFGGAIILTNSPRVSSASSSHRSMKYRMPALPPCSRNCFRYLSDALLENSMAGCHLPSRIIPRRI